MMGEYRLCSRMINLIHAPIRVYDEQGQRRSVYMDHGEQQDVLDYAPALLETLLGLCPPEEARLHLEGDRIIFGVLHTREQYYVVGPCCLSRDTASAAWELAKQYGMDPKLPYRLSATVLADFSEAILLLFELLSGISWDLSLLIHRSFVDEQLEHTLRSRVVEVFYSLQEEAAVHNPYSQEKREQGSIRAGDLEGLYESFRETYVGKIGVLAGDSLRQAKNLAIVLVTLACRSAMEGGVLPEIAYSLSDAYIQKAEELNHAGQVVALARQAEVEYCQMVHHLAGRQTQNPLVIRCKELILQQMHTKISIQSLAEELEINPNYLSQLFAKEEGVNLSAYIAQEKVNFAKNRLIYTQDSYEEIAYAFGFFSQSHFGRVFKKYTGMTPRQFRETYGQQKRQETQLGISYKK